MGAVLSVGIAVIVALQALGAWLTGPMKALSFVGSEPFFTMFLPGIYWSVDAALGLRLCFILLGGTGLNELVKLPLHGPRPYWVSPDVKPLAVETSFGVPSGHSQISAGFWGMLAAVVGRAWLWAAALSLVALIGVSRMYLGVHFPHDVVVGWTLGFLTLWAVTRLWDPVAAAVRALSMAKQVTLALAVSLGMVLAGVLLAYLSRDFTPPPAWIAGATRAGGAPPQPLSLSQLLAAAGTLLGQCVGLAWMQPRGGFSATGPMRQRVLRLLLGMLGIAVIYLGLKELLPKGEGLIPSSCRYLRYALLGLWVTGGATWIFGRLRLTDR